MHASKNRRKNKAITMIRSDGEAPVINPTLRAGIEAMLAAAGVWLVPQGQNRASP
jgi:hypothetical protein